MKIFEIIMNLMRWGLIGAPLLIFLVPVFMFKKAKLPQKPILLGVYFGALYLLLIGFVAYGQGGENAGGWIWVGLLSRPAAEISYLLMHSSEKLNSNFGMFIRFGTFGTLQYFFIGSVLGWLFVRQKK